MQTHHIRSQKRKYIFTNIFVEDEADFDEAKKCKIITAEVKQNLIRQR